MTWFLLCHIHILSILKLCFVWVMLENSLYCLFYFMFCSSFCTQPRPQPSRHKESYSWSGGTNRKSRFTCSWWTFLSNRRTAGRNIKPWTASCCSVGRLWLKLFFFMKFIHFNSLMCFLVYHFLMESLQRKCQCDGLNTDDLKHLELDSGILWKVAVRVVF